jgi:phage baseplate assembly protein W
MSQIDTPTGLPPQTSLGFPFRIAPQGRVEATGGDDAIRGKIIQVLFTAPGERVNRPDFGCGLFNQVFAPNDPVRAAATEFTIGEALSRWLDDDIRVDAVSVEPDGEVMRVEVVYTRRRDRTRQAVRIQFR